MADANVQDRAQALRIIHSLRKGSNCLEGVSLFSAGREKLFRAAINYFEEIEICDNSIVRCLKGRYGHGKTHFFARLIEIAHSRNWVTSYVQVSGKGAGAELHRFNEIYAAIVRNCLCRDLVAEEAGQIVPGRVPGWNWILDRWFAELRRQAGAREGGDTPVFILRDVIEQTLTSIRRRWSIHGSFAEALRQYALAKVNGDEEWGHLLQEWFSGEDVHSRGGETRKRLREEGIKESVNRKNAKEMLRSLSAFLRYRGFGGILILIDEVENVLHEPPSARRAAYTILRELIDNVDDRHGMIRGAFYISGTPDLFESEKGITEYEALAARLLLPGGAQHHNPAAPVIDLTVFPLTSNEMVGVATHITSIYSVAKQWDPPPDTESEIVQLLHDLRKKIPDLSMRIWVRAVVEWLDEAQQR